MSVKTQMCIKCAISPSVYRFCPVPSGVKNLFSAYKTNLNNSAMEERAGSIWKIRRKQYITNMPFSVFAVTLVFAFVLSGLIAYLLLRCFDCETFANCWVPNGSHQQHLDESIMETFMKMRDTLANQV